MRTWNGALRHICAYLKYKLGILLTYYLPGIHWVVPKAGHFPFQLIDMIGARCRTRTGTAAAGQGILSPLRARTLVPVGIAADILGHEKKTLSYGLYSSGSSMQRKREAIEKLVYPA
jgi:hypothetical protein